MVSVSGDGRLGVEKVGEVRLNTSGQYVFESLLLESELWPGKSHD